MRYSDEAATLAALEPRILRALERACWSIKDNVGNQQDLFNAVFSNQTRFNLREVALLAWHSRFGTADLTTEDGVFTDTQIQNGINTIVPDLISRQTDTNRPIVGL
jgi:hypothetical protein